jgi:hypothetical protein
VRRSLIVRRELGHDSPRRNLHTACSPTRRPRTSGPRTPPDPTRDSFHAAQVGDGLHEPLSPQDGLVADAAQGAPSSPRSVGTSRRRTRRRTSVAATDETARTGAHGRPSGRPSLTPCPVPPRHGGDPTCPAPPSPRTSSSRPSERPAPPPAVTGPSIGCSRAPAVTSPSPAPERRGRRGPHPRRERPPGRAVHRDRRRRSGPPHRSRPR